MQLLKTHAFTAGTKVQIYMAESILIKALKFKQSLSCSVSISLMLGCEVRCENLSTLPGLGG